jgi:hypothetical protein
LTCICMHIKLKAMRTTIEITDEQRSKLLALAASKGMKGFSGLVQKALDEFLSKSDSEEQRIEEALSMRGSLDEDEAQALLEECASIRESWR